MSTTGNGGVLVRGPSKDKPLSRAPSQGLIHHPVTSGPWGGEGGNCWDDGVYSGIRQIVISSGKAIDSIKIEYDKNGESIWCSKHGGNGGFSTDKIRLDYPNEILIYIIGHHGSFYQSGPGVIRSLTFYTNLRKYGPYGVEGGTAFSSPTKGSKIVGFHGRDGLYLDALGVYTQLFVGCGLHGHEQCPASMLLPRIISTVRDIVEAVKVPQTEQDLPATRIQKRLHSAPVPAGPWGGRGGNPWDDGVSTGIRQIVLAVGEVIDHINVEYQRNAHTLWSGRHGGRGGFKTHTIRFDYPDEYLKRISGFYGRFAAHKPVAVRSLTFHTNCNSYGPYGVEIGTSFSSPLTGRKILGFHGRSGWYLDAIGVHVVMDQPEETDEDHVQNTWVEFVSRVIHQRVVGENGSNHQI